MKIEFEPIGIIRSPFRELKGMPIQPASSRGAAGSVEVLPEFTSGLKDLEGFSHIILIYFFHLIEGYKLEVVPFLDTEARGLFATRAPKRPNPIGISVVSLESVRKNILHISSVDIADGTPLLDIKPYVPDFNPRGEVRTGWIEKAKKEIPQKNSDGRFL